MDIYVNFGEKTCASMCVCVSVQMGSHVRPCMAGVFVCACVRPLCMYACACVFVSAIIAFAYDVPTARASMADGRSHWHKNR